MNRKQRVKERREKRREEISLLRTIPYYDNERWWTSDTVAVVTGANRGIGFQIAHQLAFHGLTVILASRVTGVGEEAANVLREGGLSVVFHQLDIVDPSSIEAFSKWIKKTYGGIDILVNNAGVNFNAGSDNSVEFAEKVIATNYYGTKDMIKAMIPLMRPSDSGARIVNVSSRLGRLNGRRNRIGNIDLRKKLEDDESLSEGVDRPDNEYILRTINAYTRLMWRMLSEQPEGHKIYITCCCPGWVKTAMTGWAGHTSPEEGADTAVWLALLPDPSISGKFFSERREINF
ncbi:Carbonyl reductase [NADPH] 1 [Sesamum angolense]|uniref:Short-chain dehydrogenase/reductase n=1 Tax=Sesamum angolense TaxID=2727404 RepID=A0AAE1XF89_9LAMI|nr:Carbonyl reductase [NADPH] 1 [Sesamum angolense]